MSVVSALGASVLVAAGLLLSVASAGANSASITVTPAQGKAGDVIEVSGQGFIANDSITIEVYRPGLDAGGDVLATVAADSAGIFSVQIELPTTIGVPGARVIIAFPASLGEHSGGTLAQAPRVDFQVLQPQQLPITGGIPSHQFNAGPAASTLAIAVGLILTGLAGIALGLTRRTGHILIRRVLD
ncbi:MAG TPA: hypothetical protein VMR52_06440 [Dehalococcoidia bacterium]|nr:hypothetical protein [Dehalococcoidia bacterium]